MRENLTLRERHRLPWKLDHPIFVTTKHQQEPTVFLWTTRLRPQVRYVIVSVNTQNFNRPLKAVSLDNAGSNPRYWPCVYFALFRTGSARRTPGDLRGAGGRPAGVPITFFRCEVFNMRAHSTPSRLAHSVCLGFLI